MCRMWNKNRRRLAATRTSPTPDFFKEQGFGYLIDDTVNDAAYRSELTPASLMVTHGVPVIVVSRRLDYSKVSITLDISGHPMPEMQNEAAEMIDERMISVKAKLPKKQI